MKRAPSLLMPLFLFSHPSDERMTAEVAAGMGIKDPLVPQEAKNAAVSIG
jgi:hypothetical protein